MNCCSRKPEPICSLSLQESRNSWWPAVTNPTTARARNKKKITFSLPLLLFSYKYLPLKEPCRKPVVSGFWKITFPAPVDIKQNIQVPMWGWASTGKEFAGTPTRTEFSPFVLPTVPDIHRDPWDSRKYDFILVSGGCEILRLLQRVLEYRPSPPLDGIKCRCHTFNCLILIVTLRKTGWRWNW